MRPVWPSAAGGIAIMLLLSLLLVLPMMNHSFAAPRAAEHNAGHVIHYAAGVTHLALFEFKGDIAADDLHSATSHMLDLQNKCLHPSTGKPYIKSVRGGRNIAGGNRSANRTHAFVVEFASVADRDYYLETDRAHKDFLTYVLPFLETPNLAVDFVTNNF